MPAWVLGRAQTLRLASAAAAPLPNAARHHKPQPAARTLPTSPVVCSVRVRSLVSTAWARKISAICITSVRVGPGGRLTVGGEVGGDRWGANRVGWGGRVHALTRRADTPELVVNPSAKRK